MVMGKQKNKLLSPKDSEQVSTKKVTIFDLDDCTILFSEAKIYSCLQLEKMFLLYIRNQLEIIFERNVFRTICLEC